jgi:hypothetical protein
MNISSSDTNNLDAFIEQLLNCKPLRENEVKFLCEKVMEFNFRPKKFFKKRAMSKQ